MYKHTLFLLLLLFPLCASAQSNLRLNEIMISNVDGYMVANDFPDSWVEIYNPTKATVNLKGYTLRHQTADGEGSYTFTTNVNVLARNYAVICCDKLATTFHTSFRLDAEGGTITLVDPQGQEVESLTYPPMIAPGVGYGRVALDRDEWQWERTATPKMANVGLFTDVLLPNPEFNVGGHVMSGAEEVRITMPKGDLPADTKIYLTLNGDEPTEESLSAEEFTYTVDKSMVIRAKLISQSALSGPSVTQSYIFHPRKTELPILSVVTKGDYLYDDTLGIFSSVPAFNNIINYKRDWRRPVNVEYLGVLGEQAMFNQLSETGLSGYTSRAQNQKSMKFYAHKRFGENRYRGVMWTEKGNVEKQKSFLMRNGGSTCNAGRINDASMQMLFGSHIDNYDYQCYRPAIMYINGEYHGIYGLRERSNDDYVYSNYDGLEDIEVADQSSYKGSLNNTPLFREFYDAYHRDDVTYAELEQMMDVDNFMKAFITECFTSNHDFPHNNVSMWRPTAEGGKWRWIMKDMDVLSIPNFNMFKYLLGTTNEEDIEYSYSNRSGTVKARVLYQKMMSFPEFREKFLDTYIVYLGDFLKPSARGLIQRAL